MPPLPGFFMAYFTCGLTQFFLRCRSGRRSGCPPHRPPYCSASHGWRSRYAAARRRSAGSAAVSPWPAVRVRTHRDRQRGSHPFCRAAISACSSTAGPRPALMKMAEDFYFGKLRLTGTDGESLRSGGRIRQTKSASCSRVSRSQ